MLSIERATSADMPQIRSLVIEAGLPLNGLGDVPTETFVARDGVQIVGTASVEQHGTHGLLRSVAVAATSRGGGVGSALVAAAERHAGVAGLDDLYLLTDTAADFFARRGYRTVGRADGPVPIMQSVEWSEACADTATAMVLDTPGS